MIISDEELVALKTKLKNQRYPLPRSIALRTRLKHRVMDYIANAARGGPFEAKGLLVTGPARSG